MRIGIRGKLVLLLIVTALVPLTAALVAIAVLGRQQGRESFGQLMEGTVKADALAMRVAMTKDIEKLHLALQHQSAVPEALAQRTKDLGPTRRAELDAVWAKTSPTPAEQRLIAETLENPVALRLRQVQRADPRIAECLVTDRLGQLVAATQRTSDYDQADELWWQNTRAGNEGRIHVPPVERDLSSGVWAVNVCLPLRHRDEVIGVAKVVYDLSKWMAFVSRELADRRVNVALVRQEGTIVFWEAGGGEDEAPLPGMRRLPEWDPATVGAGRSGWRVTRGGRFQAYAPVEFEDEIANIPARMPAWTLVQSVPASAPLAPVHMLTMTVLGIGLVLILSVFLLGFLLAERSIIRRLHRLEQATHRVADGDLSHRIGENWGGRRLLGADEIDDLAGDFNRMVRRIEESYRELQEANELRRSFLQVAGHELRTPISYILGMTSLLRTCDDGQRLRAGVRSMGGKAQRLDEIIQAMFKLMDTEQQTAMLDYEDVDVRQLLEEVYLDTMVFVEQRHQQLLIETADDLPTLHADGDKLRDVVENLVMNAVKFTPDGGTVRMAAKRELAGKVEISVIDQGPGISDEDLPHIFDAFYSTADVLKHSSGTSGYRKRGIGLGLAIVKRFVELHGGTVHVASGTEGTTMSVSIPVQPPPSDGPPPPAPVSPPAPPPPR